MLRKLVCILVIGLLAIGFLGRVTQGQNSIPPVIKKSQIPTTKYTTHTPIRINNDTDFTAQFSNRTIWNLEINGTGFGCCIYIGNCSQPFTVKNCYLHNTSGRSVNYFDNIGLFLYKSSNGLLLNNTGRGSVGEGICLEGSSTNTLMNNNYGDHIFLYSSNANTLTNNNWSDGILLLYSNTNTLTNNTFNMTSDYGIYILSSNTNVLSQNLMYGCSICIGGSLLSNFNTQSIDVTNFVNGKPVYYLKNQNSTTIPPGAGQVILANCFYIVVNRQSLINCSDGIEVAYSNYCTRSGNNCSDVADVGIVLSYSNTNTLTGNACNGNSYYGILLGYSSNNRLINNTCSRNMCDGINFYNSSVNTLTNNNCNRNSEYGINLNNFSNNNMLTSNCCDNSTYGINLEYSLTNTFTCNLCSANTKYGFHLNGSQENHIYHNNFISNNGGGKQAYDDSVGNFWNSPYPSGGNYWSDWTSPDTKSGPNQKLSGPDGIVDFPYVIDGGVGAMDHYPLVHIVVVPETPLSPFPLIIISVIIFTVIVVRLKKR